MNVTQPLHLLGRGVEVCWVTLSQSYSLGLVVDGRRSAGLVLFSLIWLRQWGLVVNVQPLAKPPAHQNHPVYHRKLLHH